MSLNTSELEVVCYVPMLLNTGELEVVWYVPMSLNIGELEVVWYVPMSLNTGQLEVVWYVPMSLNTGELEVVWLYSSGTYICKPVCHIFIETYLKSTNVACDLCERPSSVVPLITSYVLRR